jgi:hypothetical protein
MANYIKTLTKSHEADIHWINSAGIPSPRVHLPCLLNTVPVSLLNK